jgi:cytochrome c oxidase cbb3-type subunit III
MNPARALAFGAALALASCNQSQPRQDSARSADGNQYLTVALINLSPGGTPPVTAATNKGKDYQKDSQKTAEGKQLFTQMNCGGCHSHGGGGMGPPLTKPQNEWIYGSAIENIVSTLREGRPKGMPSWRGKLPDDQLWAIAAYVHSLVDGAPEPAGE